MDFTIDYMALYVSLVFAGLFGWLALVQILRHRRRPTAYVLQPPKDDDGELPTYSIRLQHYRNEVPTHSTRGGQHRNGGRN